jgi:hypothetical protein
MGVYIIQAALQHVQCKKIMNGIRLRHCRKNNEWNPASLAAKIMNGIIII